MPRDTSPAVELAPAEIAIIKDLYLRGQYRAAYEHGRAFGPLCRWSGPAGRLIAGRLAMQLGAPRLGRRLHVLAFRESPAYPEAVYYHARFRVEQFGPLSAWEFQRQHTDWSESSPELRADWAALQAFTAARLRDFDRAEEYLAQSEKLAPNRPWHAVEKASILEFQEKFDDALAAARGSLALQPWFRPGVQAVGHLLMRRGELNESAEFLGEAASHLQSGLILAQLAAVQIDLGRLAEARSALERYDQLSPLLEPDLRDWLSARRSDIGYSLGEYTEAETQARRVAKDDDGFYPAIAARLALGSPAAPTRILLPIHLESGPPATIPQLLKSYWKQPLDWPAAEMTAALEGLPDAAERRCYERAGWTVREFRLEPGPAYELIRRGVPFQITLVEAGFGQSRLIVGADETRGSVFLAEPLERKPVESPTAALRKRGRATGPRCLVALPPCEAHRLAGLELPGSDLLDALHRVQSELAEWHFDAARSELDQLLLVQPASLFAKLGELAWAKQTAHPVLQLEAAERLLADFPEESTFAMAKGNALRELGRTADRAAFLEDVGTRADADPILMQSLAQVLLTNPHRQDEAERLLRRSLRIRPHAAAGYFLLGAQRWENRRFAEAVELNRFATCLDDREEQFAEVYVRVARAAGMISDAIRLLQKRVLRPEVPPASAVRALHAALLERGEPDFARTALDKAIEKLAARGEATAEPSEPGGEKPAAILAELRLFRVEQLVGRGEFAAAEIELNLARPELPQKIWLKASARYHRAKPAYRAALLNLREFDAIEPLNAEVHRLIVSLLSDTEGKAAAKRFLEERAGRFPSFYPILKLRSEWLTGDGDPDGEAAIGQLRNACPRDAWAERQLALFLGERRRLDDAFAAIERAGELEPNHPSQFAVRANIHRRADHTEEACETFRRGLRRNIDHELSIVELVATARGVKDKKNALRFVFEELRRQPTNGDGLLAFRDQYLPLIDDPEEQEQFFGDLELFLDERPDLWQAWSVVIEQLIMMHRAEEAVEMAKEATTRFPLLSRLWLDLAEARSRTNAPDEQIAALRQAVLATPAWIQPVKELADALGEAEERQAALAVLETHRGSAPLDPLAHGFLAEELWESDRGTEALASAERAARHEPGYDWAWGAVANWGERVERQEAALELARDLARDRGGDARVFLKLARFLNRFEQTPEALAALDRAIELDPKSPDAYDLKAERLAEVGRFDEALATVAPAALADDLPLTLQGRAAWVEAKRGNYGAAIPSLQALVSIDPNYYWAWQQLAEWFHEIGKAEAYREAAEEMCRLRPEHPTPLTMLGEAKILCGDRDGGKADLREALRLHNGYSPAAAILFDACLADGELREARTALAVLQEHMAGPEGSLKQLVYAVRTEDRSSAERTFRELTLHAGESSPGLLQMAIGEMRRGGWEAVAINALRDAWTSGEEFNPWAAIFWLDTSAAEEAGADERIAACDAAIQFYKAYLPAYDRKAEQLARAGRFDEARAACLAPPVEPKPLTLRGRMAWIEAQRGDKSKAIDLLKICLEEDPDYTWAWRQLAQWYDDLGRPKDCLDAANQLVRLAPGDPYAFGIRGEARRILGDHRGARDDYEQAFQLDPNFNAAGHQLMSEQLATDDLGGAERTLAALRENADGPLLQLRAVQLAVRQKNLAEARTLLRRLIEDDSVPKPLLRDSAREFDEQGWTAEVDDEFAQAMERPGSSAAAAGVWAERRLAAGEPWKVSDRLQEIVGRNADAGREAALVLASGLVFLDQPETATATIQRFSELLRDNDDGWARAGVTLVRAKQYRLAIAWLRDWPERRECDAWMLRALADAYRAVRQDDDCERTLRAALEKDPAELPPDMLAWLAIIDGERGRIDAAAGHLESIDPIGLPDGTKLLLAMGQAMVRVARSPKEFGEAREDLKAVAGACDADDVPLGAARWFPRVAWRIAKLGGGLSGRIWALWLRLRPLVKEG